MLSVMADKMTPAQAGARGGAASTVRKARAARENGKRGGRPRREHGHLLGADGPAQWFEKGGPGAACGGGHRAVRAPRLDELDAPEGE
jgi:hypothetical protein